ncbi:hypothetical protein [Kitasatospora griseola]|uniref:hypothetical protein n=1 Tax=Kitasatospora griseola TaxID=2064 RepID=UPI00382C44F8
MTDLSGPPWSPPDPAELPEWRSRMVSAHQQTAAYQSMALAINAGRTNLLPLVPGIHASPGAVGAQILLRQEAQALREAELYYATGDMTSLALAAAASPPKEAFDRRRLPAERGLIMFAEPIGGYTEDVGAALTGTVAGRAGVAATVTVPIVAASWTTWSPDLFTLSDARPGERIRWVYRTAADGPQEMTAAHTGVWVTYYSASGKFSALPAATVLGSMADGTVMTAGDITAAGELPGQGPLTWDTEVLLVDGAGFAAARPDTTDQWTHVLYTAWQMMSQRGKGQLTDLAEIPRPRAGRKRDAREGITDTGAVRIVHVHSAHRPTPAAAEQDAAASSGRRAPQWTCRWPVRPHRRDHCMNPGLHAEGGCTHEERIIPAVVKGPADKPLRLRERVNLWDSQPK